MLLETKEGALAILARAVADSFARLRGLNTAQAEAAAALRATALGVLKEWEGIENNVGEINRRYEAKAMQLLDATNSRYFHVSLSETLVITAFSGLWAAGRPDCCCCCCCWKHLSVSPSSSRLKQVSGAHPQVPR